MHVLNIAFLCVSKHLLPTIYYSLCISASLSPHSRKPSPTQFPLASAKQECLCWHLMLCHFCHQLQGMLMLSQLRTYVLSVLSAPNRKKNPSFPFTEDPLSQKPKLLALLSCICSRFTIIYKSQCFLTPLIKKYKPQLYWSKWDTWGHSISMRLDGEMIYSRPPNEHLMNPGFPLPLLPQHSAVKIL